MLKYFKKPNSGAASVPWTNTKGIVQFQRMRKSPILVRIQEKVLIHLTRWKSSVNISVKILLDSKVSVGHKQDTKIYR